MATLAQVKDQLNIDQADTTDDTELTWYLTVATDWVTAKVSDVTPTPVQHAILELVRHLYDTQRGPGVTAAADDMDSVGRADDFLTIPRVRELLGPYLAHGPQSSFPPAPCWPDPSRTFVAPPWWERLL